jgi:RNA polymerase sigma-70 factor, ECF subfamily
VSQVVRLPTSPRPVGEAGQEDDVRLVHGLREHEPWAAAVLANRYLEHVRRVLVRVMGAGEPELDDLVQEVFTRALAGAHRLSFAGALTAWLTNIAVFTGRETIRRRSRWRWLGFVAEPPERPAPQASADVSEAARAAYALLERLPVDERIAFALRTVDGMDLQEIAAACRVSVPTVRRRLARAEQRFNAMAAKSEPLSPWLRST